MANSISITDVGPQGAQGVQGATGSAGDSAPASASSTGTAGDIAYDSNYIYVCVATNTWKRAALSTW